MSTIRKEILLGVRRHSASIDRLSEVENPTRRKSLQKEMELDGRVKQKIQLKAFLGVVSIL